MYTIRYITCTLLFLSCLAACKSLPEPLIIPEIVPLDQIGQRGILNVCACYNTTDYYVYRGIPKGFHYELLKDFANLLDVKLHIEINSDEAQSIKDLNAGKYDLVAMSLSVINDRQETCRFSDPLFHTRKVLVQNKQCPRIDSIQQLQGKEINIQQGSSTKNFLQHLSDSLRLDLKITEIKDITYEDILLQIEENRIEFTVIDEHLAQTVSQSMPNLDHSLPLSGDIPIAWATSKNASSLTDEINYWLATLKKNDKLPILYNRYFKSSYVTTLRNSKYYKLQNGMISSFDTIIKKEAQAIGWDWRLLAALIYQESKFNPEAESQLGAVGLMQIMPETAERFGLSDFFEPADNIHAGAAYLSSLEKLFNKYPLDSTERKKFTLAAYNAGPGHVMDAMKLTEAYGKNPYVWHQNVDYFLLHKSRPEFYRDSLVNHGYCDGKQVYNFVNNIVETYTHYKNIIPR